MTAARQTRAPGLRELFDAHHAFVWRTACRLGVSMSDIDDVVQETFIVAARRLPEFEGRSSLRTWLYSIVSHVAHTFRRSQARRSRKAEAVAVSAVRSFDPYSRSDAADLVQKLAASLDDDHRVVWILCDLEGLTAPEVADGLCVNVNTVYSRLRSARRQSEAALERLVRAGEGDA
jgi:RNA polymerase sigma-70 factor (ECF subfamily)